VPLSLAERNLEAIAAAGISVPGYDRAKLAPRILHIGVGGFHRAHLARYTDEVAASGGDWGIRGVGLLDADRRMAATLGAQDHLYTLIARESSRTDVAVVGSIVDFALVAGDDQGLARLVVDPAVAILSMTITEGGYSLAHANPTIEAIVTALARRMEGGGGPITVLSCDNLPGNGDRARDAILTVAAERERGLADAIGATCKFPNSMVDRITPQTTDEDRAWLEQTGIVDGWPVVCEAFRQWVVEDGFAAGRPEWEQVGVLFSDRVHDWELYKLRMLNASHSCMAYLMALAGVIYVDEAMAIPLVGRYLERLLSNEAIPTLTEIPGYPAVEYAETVLRRLANTGVRDQVARLCIDGTAKFPSFLLPTVEAQLAADRPVACSALALAAWARYLAVTPLARRAPDSHGDRAAELARRALGDPPSFLELEIFADAIRSNDRFRQEFTDASDRLASIGPLASIEHALR
jgi:mannitol 2-dehydrogenase